MERHRKILVIEDDPGVGKSLTSLLEQEGFHPSLKTTGEDGVSFARSQQPDLILLDVRLPDGSGFDFCRQMRTDGIRQPILMLTVRSSETDKVLGLEMGADDYITKPFNAGELISRIRAQLRRAYGELSSIHADLLYAQDLIINRSKATVTRGSKDINLTPTEFRLLVYLARHPNQALTRNQILEEVWSDSFSVESERTVNVHIRRLREKIERTPGKPKIILTVPGIGYRLKA